MSDKINVPVKEIYNDLLSPSVKSLGNTVSLLPRAIAVALHPIEKFIVTEECNMAECRRLVEKNLRSVNPDDIVFPEPYVAVPAIQSISYCMDSDELRSMYASLLAKSIYSKTKDSVHPAFVEIIKQLSPLDALILKVIHSREAIALVDIRLQEKDEMAAELSQDEFIIETEGMDIHQLFCLLPEIDASEQSISISFDNLSRLGLVHISNRNEFLSATELYSAIKECKFVRDIYDQYSSDENNEIVLLRRHGKLSPFGLSFSDICLNDIG